MILVIGDSFKYYNSSNEVVPIFFKNPALQRLVYYSRRQGHKAFAMHFMSHIPDDTYLEIINKLRPKYVFISTSFLIPYSNENHQDRGMPDEVFKKIILIADVVKKNGGAVLLSGFEVALEKKENNKFRFNEMEEHVDFFVYNSDEGVIDHLDTLAALNKKWIDGKVFALTDYSKTSNLQNFQTDTVGENEYTLTEMAKGCIYSCEFCEYGSLGKKVWEYIKPYESLKYEIEKNYYEKKIRFYQFSDNIINDYDKKLQALIKIKNETGIDLRWSGFVRPDRFNLENVKLLKESGMIGAYIGIESLNTETGRHIGKNTDKKIIIEKLHIFRNELQDAALLNAGFIAGLPHESETSISETIAWSTRSNEAKYLLDDVAWGTLYLHPVRTMDKIKEKRGNPFGVYSGVGHAWESPWSSSRACNELLRPIKKIHYEDPLYVFMLPSLHNVGLDIEGLVVKKRRGIELTRAEVLSVQNENKNKIKQYVAELRESIKKISDDC